MDPVTSFLQFVDDELQNDPALCPCADPAEAGKLIAWLGAMAAAFRAEQNRVAQDQSSARELMRMRISEGVRQHLRGGPAPVAADNGDAV